MVKDDNGDRDDALSSLRAQFNHFKARSEELRQASSGLVKEEAARTSPPSQMGVKRVLLVSYDEPLCYSRRLLLELPASGNLEVVSALGLIEGMEECRHPRFDLLVL
jgi:hypothetical protein